MIAQSKNRVQAIKCKFESLNKDNIDNIVKPQLCKQGSVYDNTDTTDKENAAFNLQYDEKDSNSESSSDSWVAEPNTSQLYSRNNENEVINQLKRPKSLLGESKVPLIESKVPLSESQRSGASKKVLTRQTSDPGKKLHRSHAFRCDRSKIISPKRHGSCYGRQESSSFSMEKRLPKDRLKKLSSFIEDQMRKDNFVHASNEKIVGHVLEVKDLPLNSIPDSEVPKHILDQYAKVVKPKNNDKKECTTDSGVSSETEELKNVFEEEKSCVKRLTSQFENSDNNLHSMNDLCASSETIKLERKNPNLVLTSTLKKALKQPLPLGPPPKKPPRTFVNQTESSDIAKKDTKKMLEKLEQVLQKRESNTLKAETVTQEPKEIHYLCTEILDITQRTLLPNTVNNCLKSLNCAGINNSTLSLPYTQLNNSEQQSLLCSCSNDNLPDTPNSIVEAKCIRCQINSNKEHEFKCHLHCECKMDTSKFYIDNEHIYDEPCDDVKIKINHYGTLNHSKSMEDLQGSVNQEEEKIYDIPCEISRPATPESSPNIYEEPKTKISPRPDLERLKSIFEHPESHQTETENKKIEVIQKNDFQKLKQSFENVNKDDFKIKNGNTETMADEFGAKKFSTTKPPTRPRPLFTKITSKSTENLNESLKDNFSSERKKYLKDQNRAVLTRDTCKKDTTQLDVDRENLNQLMTELYETVAVACGMAADPPGRFPADATQPASEDSVKLTRSLTEKRKNYVRRVSSRVAYLDSKNVRQVRNRHQTAVCSYKTDNTVRENQYSTFRSWRSFRASQNNLTSKMEAGTERPPHLNSGEDRVSIDEKTGCLDIGLPFEPRERGLFNVCLLAGLNYSTGEPYVKTVFPSQVQVPAHIENLIFPETLASSAKGEWTADGKAAQCYSLVLTDEKGERSYGYCRRVLPEGACVCLPLCYCLIGKYRAPGFYYKVLQEIESHHGRSELEIYSILQQLFESDFPNPGEHITINNIQLQRQNSNNTDSKCKTMPDMRKSDNFDFSYKTDVINSSDNIYENNNSTHVFLDLDGPRMKLLKRPIEPRADDDNLSLLLDTLGAGLAVKVFGSLLLERKVLICGEQLSQVSSCMEALQMALYPFVWQQPLISTIPAEIQREVLEAPLPMLAGLLLTAGPLDTSGVAIEEGMLIDLSHSSKVLFCQGDEATILPTAGFKTLKTALQMEYKRDRFEDTKTRNVMISEAFLRFFVDILGDFWKYFSVGEMKDGDFGKGNIIFDKDAFVRNTASKQNQYFLEWFTETAMFNHFIQNMAASQPVICQTSPVNVTAPVNVTDNAMQLVDTPLPDFYDLFNERVKSRTKIDANKCDKLNYRSAMNKRMKLLKTKLKELVG